MTHEPYFMVHCPCNGPATFMHERRDDALNEAKRLARENPGKSFYVLMAVHHVCLPSPEPTVTDCEEIPF